ncbi:MAG: Asp-tRNA(Asn)/Glu-tRNA(Gln) amidotransferase subunit GatA, partial [Beijerinckiaceae bacterium]|nr:Asp-tRNA(Asn)/Glu-tRNA(Gln) amidotransferase subunit GatA [Beijerinckiaceae bacterium]
MTELTHMTLADARDALKAKKISSVELTQAHIAAVEAARPLGAYVLETPDQARAMAQASDEKIAKGEA